MLTHERVINQMFMIENIYRYASVVKPMMAQDCRYLLEALQYDDTKYGGPPHHLSDEAINDLFGKNSLNS